MFTPLHGSTFDQQNTRAICIGSGRFLVIDAMHYDEYMYIHYLAASELYWYLRFAVLDVKLLLRSHEAPIL